MGVVYDVLSDDSDEEKHGNGRKRKYMFACNLLLFGCS